MVKSKYKKRALKAWRTMRKRGYITKKEKRIQYNNKTKNTQRELILNLMFQSCKDWRKNNLVRYSPFESIAIILESPDLLCLKKIDKMLPYTKEEREKEQYNCYRPHPSNIYIPNNKEFKKFPHDKDCHCCKHRNVWGMHTLEFNPKSSFFPKPILLNKSYLELITSHMDHIKPFSCCLIWADYCGAFSNHLEDIENTFKNKILGNHSFFAVTFCKRDAWIKKKAKGYSMTNCIVAVNDFVSKIAKKYGYKVELLPESGIYKTTMFTAIFSIKYEYMEKNRNEIKQMLDQFYKIQTELTSKLSEIDIYFIKSK